MKRIYTIMLLSGFTILKLTAHQLPQDSLSIRQARPIKEIVVTGTRNETDVRHLSQTVSVVSRTQIEQSLQPSLLPLLSEQVPGLFVTARGTMGYGVSNGAAGSISLRGLSGGSGRLMVLIDGHPQYAGIFGHPISDAYQSFLAERVEVLRGPASAYFMVQTPWAVSSILSRARCGRTGYRQTFTPATVLTIRPRRN